MSENICVRSLCFNRHATKHVPVLFIIAAVVLLVSCSKTPISTSELQIRNGLLFLPNTTAPYSGEVIDYFSNGQLKHHFSIKEGKKRGNEVAYFENGAMKYSANNDDSGRFVRYDSSGNVISEMNWKDGLLNGREYMIVYGTISGTDDCYREVADLVFSDGVIQRFKVEHHPPYRSGRASSFLQEFDGVEITVTNLDPEGQVEVQKMALEDHIQFGGATEHGISRYDNGFLRSIFRRHSPDSHLSVTEGEESRTSNIYIEDGLISRSWFQITMKDGSTQTSDMGVFSSCP